MSKKEWLEKIAVCRCVHASTTDRFTRWSMVDRDDNFLGFEEHFEDGTVVMYNDHYGFEELIREAGK